MSEWPHAPAAADGDDPSIPLLTDRIYLPAVDLDTALPPSFAPHAPAVTTGAAADEATAYEVIADGGTAQAAIADEAVADEAGPLPVEREVAAATATDDTERQAADASIEVELDRDLVAASDADFDAHQHRHESDVALSCSTGELFGRLVGSTVTYYLSNHATVSATVFAGCAGPGCSVDPNTVKVVTDRDGYALYFSRATIPWNRDRFAAASSPRPEWTEGVLRHLGIYAYRAGFLAGYAQLPASPLERIESLEQLRVLWNGGRIAVEIAAQAPPAGVDTAEDLERVRAVLAAAQR